MVDIEEAIQRWREEGPRYKELTPYIHEKIKEALFDKSFGEKIESRTKDEGNLIKKIYERSRTDPDYSYDNITDKTGVRVICKFKEDVKLIADIIEPLFDDCERENHGEELRYYEQGYKSVHLDVSFKEDQRGPEELKKFAGLNAEIQVRTLCENVWADIYHDIGYKPSNSLPNNAKRELHCLGGLLEVADGCFSSINNLISENQSFNENKIRLKLAGPFFKKIRMDYYNVPFSLSNIKKLMPLLDFDTIIDFNKAIDDFLSMNEEKIDYIIEERKDDRIEIPYLTQPELFLIFYLIECDVDRLKSLWEEEFYINDLRKLSLWWGNSIDDLDDTL